MNISKYIEQLDILKIYMRLKIDYGITEDFDYFLNNIRISGSHYTYEKYLNFNTFSNNYNCRDFEKTYKLYTYDN